MKRAYMLIAGLALPLAACGDDPSPSAPTGSGSGAQGELLGGSISDEMLPLDQVRSQAPSMGETGEAGEGGGPASGGDQENGGEDTPAEGEG